MLQVLSHEDGFRSTLRSRIEALKDGAPSAVKSSMMLEEYGKLIMVMRECAHRIDEGHLDDAKAYLRNMANRGQAWLAVLADDTFPPDAPASPDPAKDAG